jgi:hypothetical protein
MAYISFVVDLSTLLLVIVVGVRLVVAPGTITLVGSMAFLSSANNILLIMVVTNIGSCGCEERAEGCTARKSLGLCNSGSVVPQHGTHSRWKPLPHDR